jgi:DNA-binding protein HU-beta
MVPKALLVTIVFGMVPVVSSNPCYAGANSMRDPVMVHTGFPSAAKTAKKLGVSKKVARDLSSLAERSLKTGEFVLPGVGRLVRVHVKSRDGRNPESGAANKVPGRKVVTFRVSKSVKDAVASQKKK